MLCLSEQIQSIMDDNKVTKEYKNILQAYKNRLINMFYVVTLLFEDGEAYTIERSRLIPFGTLTQLTVSYDENELKDVVLPKSRKNFLVLLAFLEAETSARRSELIRALCEPDTYHNHTTRIGESLLKDANYFSLPEASLSDLYRHVNLENNRVLLTRFRSLLTQQSYQTLVSDVKMVKRVVPGAGEGETKLQIEFDRDDNDKTYKLSKLNETLRTLVPSEISGISVVHGRRRGTYSLHTIQAYLTAGPP
jgi:hypothetical protein